MGGTFLGEIFKGKNFQWEGKLPRKNFQRETIHRGIYQNSYTKFKSFVLFSLCQFNFACGDILGKFSKELRLSEGFSAGEILMGEFHAGETFH